MDEAIRSFMQQEIAKGTSLDEVQNLVNRKFGTKYTFMDIRIMASELTVDWNDGKKEEPAPASAPAKEAAPAEEDVSPAAAPQEPAAGKTVLEINKINPPGVMLSGTVAFASGASGEWMIDSYGRCGFGKVNGKPTEEDIRSFQLELQKTVGGM